MIRLEVRDETIEIADYSSDAHLQELRKTVDAFRAETGLKTDHCAGCGECCYFENLPILGMDLLPLADALGMEFGTLFGPIVAVPPQPDLQGRRTAIADMERQHGFSRRVAALLYEFNQAEPLRFTVSDDGSCRFLKDNLCTIYDKRPFTCELYVCNMGEKLSVLQEQIVRQGVWHSYHMLGWVPEEDISHNPFLGRESYAEVPLADFDVDLEDAMEKLFFYF